ncbi:hypothetical protein AX16_004142 [Volvariella volvacea WC 439]|nr:hypothetical protein AX16_004142 [Volvariella volvacea WC 439]
MPLAHWERYNTLPPLEHALSDNLAGRALQRVTNNPEFKKLLASYAGYGLCVIHRHTAIHPEQRMIPFRSKDPTYEFLTLPRRERGATAQAWLINGKAFEFTLGSDEPEEQETPPPPAALLQAFQKALGFAPSADGEISIWNEQTILGICRVEKLPGPRNGWPQWVEETKGNRNLLRRVREGERPSLPDYAITSWRGDTLEPQNCCVPLAGAPHNNVCPMPWVATPAPN